MTSSSQSLDDYLKDNAECLERLRLQGLEVEEALEDVAKAKETVKNLDETVFDGSAKTVAIEDFKKKAQLAKEKEKIFAEEASALEKSCEGITFDQVINSVTELQEKKETDIAMRANQVAQTLDICFVFDATGSMDMGKIFISVKEHIRTIIGTLQRNLKHLKFQIGLIAYRDVCDGQKQFEIIPFSGSISKVEKAMEDMECVGGGDQAEDVVGALEKAGEMNWTYHNRLLFLCGDAPCHGNKYHDGLCSDNHPEGIGDSKAALSRLIERNVQIFFWKLNNHTDKMIRVFNDECRSAQQGGDYIQTHELDMKSSLKAIGKAIQTTISESFTASISKSSLSASSLKRRGLSRTADRAKSRHSSLTTIMEDEKCGSGSSSSSLTDDKSGNMLTRGSDGRIRKI